MKNWELTEEEQMGYPKALVAGVDEVGRGCLAGPVVAAAVVLKPMDATEFKNLLESIPLLKEVTDSKLIPKSKREMLVPLIQGFVHTYAVSEASVEEIDQYNILNASHLAMVRSIDEVRQKLEVHSQIQILIDGNLIPKDLKSREDCHVKAVIKGDLKVFSIACASILAKVYRDELMDELHKLYPGFGLKDHKGYGTPKHKQMLKELGITPIHRKSFKPVKDLASNL